MGSQMSHLSWPTRLRFPLSNNNPTANNSTSFCLVQDPYWCSLLLYCVAHSAYIGCDLPSLSDPQIKVSYLCFLFR